MSPIDTHEEPWLRDALGSLLVDEPPLPPAAVVDDVRRGAVALTAAKRRRSASLAIAAAVLAVAVPVGFVLRTTPNAATPPTTSTTPTPMQTPTPTAFTPPSLDAALAGTEWMVTGQPQPLSSTPSWAYLIQPVEAPSSSSANVIVFVGRGAGPGPYLASCTPAACPGERAVVIADGATATSGYRQTSTLVGDGLLVPAGSRVVDRFYGTGTVVEVVVTPPLDATREPRAAVPARAVLTSEETGAIVALIGDPFSPPASPSPTSSRFVADGDWQAAVVAALPGTATALDGGGVSRETASAIVNVRLVRDGVGTFVRARIDTPTEGYSSPLDADPCANEAPNACTVLMPWETATVDGVPVASSVVQVEHAVSPPGQQGYAGAYTTRSVVLVQGRTVLTILSDSRDVDAAGGWTSSSKPALAIDELLPIARALPLPYLLKTAAESPLWTSKG